MHLTESNFLLYCAKYYDNPNCVSFEEFKEDTNRFKYLKKLLYNYKNKGTLKERLIINHLVVLYNVFPAKECTLMLAMKLDEYLDVLVPFLMIMGYVGDKIGDVVVSDIIIDQNVVLHLKDNVREGS